MAERQRLGMSLAAAIRAVDAAPPADSSVFAAVAAASSRPATRLSRRAMLALSRAIEDACAAAGGPSVLVGSFQREAIFRARQALWHDLARGATTCVVLADFPEVRIDGGILEVPIDDAPPLQREWAVAVAGPGLHACLTGWELLGAGDVNFEAIWTVAPAAVHAAIERVLAVARHRAPDHVPDITPTPPGGGDPLAQVLNLMDRVIARLDRATADEHRTSRDPRR